MKVKKVLKIIGILIVILSCLIIIHTIRNYIIITDLQNKILNYQDSKNYHIKSIANSNDGTNNTKMDYYRKDNQKAIFLEKITNGEVINLSIYDNGEKVDTFSEIKNVKTVKLDSGESIAVNIYNCLETDNKWQTLLGCITAKVKSTNFNEKKCYIVEGFLSSKPENVEIYIDKETGLLLKTIESEVITERTYEFENIEDSIFTEPDINQYKLT